MSTNDDLLRRRQFLKQAAGSIGLTLGAGAVAAIVSSCETTETAPTTPTGKSFLLDVSAIPQLATPGGIITRVITGLNADRAVFISRVSETAIAVFDTTCTHQQCPVDLPTQTGGNCVCSCHGAEYSSTDGRVLVQPISGSATNLKTFATSFNTSTNQLTITA
jgi:nitrite reductase/ring-hydroxylating ferredoxin subunit